MKQNNQYPSESPVFRCILGVRFWTFKFVHCYFGLHVTWRRSRFSAIGSGWSQQGIQEVS